MRADEAIASYAVLAKGIPGVSVRTLTPMQLAQRKKAAMASAAKRRRANPGQARTNRNRAANMDRTGNQRIDTVMARNKSKRKIKGLRDLGDSSFMRDIDAEEQRHRELARAVRR